MRRSLPEILPPALLLILTIFLCSDTALTGAASLFESSTPQPVSQVGLGRARTNIIWPRLDDFDPLHLGRGQGLSILPVQDLTQEDALAGRVTEPSGKPLEGVEVTLIASDLQDEPLSTLTDRDGNYQFPALTSGRYTLTPYREGYRFWPAALSDAAGSHPSQTDFSALACLPGLEECITPPLLDLPFDTSRHIGPASDLLLGNAMGQGPGRVNAWYDHTTPNYLTDKRITRWDGLEFPARGRQGVSWYDGHDGVDFSPNLVELDDLIFAAASGVVTQTVTGCLSGDLACGGYLGNQVWIDHGDGFATVYAHLQEVYVRDGERILPEEERSHPLGLMGMTGNSRGVNPTHLHFGLYYDADKNWKKGQKSLDPYGWWGDGDGWVTEAGLSSQYLWKYPLMVQSALGEEGVTLMSASGKVVAAVPPVAPGGLTSVRLLETPPSFAPTSGWRSAGVSFSLDLVGDEGMSESNHPWDEPATLQVSYASAETAHLDLTQLTIAWWDPLRLAWQALPGDFDAARQFVQTQTLHPGRFELQGPLLCPQDSQEPDDSPRDATGLSSTNLTIRSIFDIPEDQDWFWFVAKKEDPIRFQFTNLTPGLKPRLEIFDYTGVRLLATLDANTDGLLDWRPPENGSYFLRLSAPKGGPAGCQITYELVMKGVYQ